MPRVEDPSAPSPDAPLILLTGATGYVGGRLRSRLERGGRRLRLMTRRPAELRARVAPATEVVRGDVGEPATLDAALAGVHTAYYLVHSMAGGTDYRDADRRGAEAFAAAAARAGVRRIVYLGGLGSEGRLSGHLASRQEVGRALAGAGVATLELRASIVIGSGSTSFEMIRALVDRLPVMVTPRWVGTKTQPIAIEDVLDYLVEATDLDLDGSRVVEIGGPDRVSYGELMREYARQRGLRRAMVPVPVLTPQPLEPLAGPRDAGLRARRARAGGGAAQRDRRARPLRPRALPDAAARRARGDRPRPRERGPRVRGHALVGRPLVGARAALVRRRGGGVAAGRLARRPGAACRPRRPSPRSAASAAARAGTTATRSGGCAG